MNPDPTSPSRPRRSAAITAVVGASMRTRAGKADARNRLARTVIRDYAG
ncbi:hypothetical protein [Streptomyces sp. V3I7]|nr:hypothetical protein [Streptomyces sp. V3I7]MDQ0994512.1 hypothetical protein [Streptomyces sp. V3I7]